MASPTFESPFHRFDRRFFDSDDKFTLIGSGPLGGKALGLAFIKRIIEQKFDARAFGSIEVTVPTLTVVTGDAFGQFMERNRLYDLDFDGTSDERIAHAFQTADLPVEILGDVRAIVDEVHTPLAIRSSSLLEDALEHPFAGVYETKMIPNNQPDADTRFRGLVEAIKFVYASTYFRGARSYLKAVGRTTADEKMAVIIQEVVGRRFGDRYYPTVSGVARSYNFYPLGHARPEDGVVNLALGLGKTVVDGGVVWTYSPAYPSAPPPHASPADLLKNSQTRFWSVNMGRPPAYDPIAETEYLTDSSLAEAEWDGTLRFTASTYDHQNDRLVMGVGKPGARLITFAPILDMPDIPLNDLIKVLLGLAEDAAGTAVEIEFAVDLHPTTGLPARFGFLQVRPMMVADQQVDVAEADLEGPDVLIASERVLGNGVLDTISDIVYVRPDAFEAARTPAIAAELERMNAQIAAEDRAYLLIGFGRWGSADPWLGVPVKWPQVSQARAIVEATLPDMDVEPSQGAHFFHNISSFRVSYFSVHHSGRHRVDWEWLAGQDCVAETPLLRHVRTASPLVIRVDGRTGRGVIAHRSA